MDLVHDAVVLAVRGLLADLAGAAPSDRRIVEAAGRLDRLLAEHMPMRPFGRVHRVDAARRSDTCLRAFSLTGTLLAFGYPWGDLFPILLDVRLFGQPDDGEDPVGAEALGGGEIPVGESFLVQIARSHLARLADGVDPMSGLEYDEALEALDGRFLPFTVPNVVPVANLPRAVSRDVVVVCMGQLAWYGVDAVGLSRVRTLLDATWEAEARGLAVVGGAS